MPLYEYSCESCGRSYEKREGFDAPARQKCQHCGKTARRVLHAPPIVFKGSGFYKTDSRGVASATADSGPSSEAAAASVPDHAHPHAAGETHVDTGPAETAAAG